MGSAGPRARQSVMTERDLQAEVAALSARVDSLTGELRALARQVDADAADRQEKARSLLWLVLKISVALTVLAVFLIVIR